MPLGKLRLDGSVGFSDPPTGADALLATLVFDVLAVCDPVTPAITFEAGGTFPSELSLDGDPIATTLTDPGAYTLDDTPPAFDAFADITQAADASAVDGCAGAIVTWTDPTATDTCDGSPVIVCSPPSGSFFATGGPHTVTCTATDACGNQSMTTFDVTVTATNTFDVEIELASVFTPVTRCIRFMADDCTSVDVSLSFTDHDTNPATPVRAIQTIEMPCGEYTLLCAKDQQHTKWNTVGLSISGAGYVGTSIFSLTGGDTDDDGDVDINDVTLLLFQFGNTAAAGGCPWDGTTRDADFSNNGAVGSEDYTFLLASWLTTSTCACTLPSTTDNRFLPNRKRVETPIEMAVDFHPDGWIDAKDVEVFEKRNGLPHLLSKEMCR
ncbi:MAG: HYR domain-containing protein [bacterium]|nr:HYR domain-containing protein [bacterium]